MCVWSCTCVCVRAMPYTVQSVRSVRSVILSRGSVDSLKKFKKGLLIHWVHSQTHVSFRFVRVVCRVLCVAGDNVHPSPSAILASVPLCQVPSRDLVTALHGRVSIVSTAGQAPSRAFSTVMAARWPAALSPYHDRAPSCCWSSRVHRLHVSCPALAYPESHHAWKAAP